MSDAYVIIGIIVFVLIVTALVSKKLLSPAIRMQKNGEGERTKFIIDTSKMGYEYYEAKIKEWLDYNKFSGYNKNKNARYLKYYIDELILRFGFNYYRQDNLLIIEAWLVVFGNENPLVEKLYTYQDGDVDIVKGLTGNKFAADKNIPVVVNGQGKNIYIEFLSSLINMPKELHDENIVNLNDSIDYSKIRNQKDEKKKTFKTIIFILAISFALSLIIFLLQ